MRYSGQTRSTSTTRGPRKGRRERWTGTPTWRASRRRRARTSWRCRWARGPRSRPVALTSKLPGTREAAALLQALTLGASCPPPSPSSWGLARRFAPARERIRSRARWTRFPTGAEGPLGTDGCGDAGPAVGPPRPTESGFSHARECSRRTLEPPRQTLSRPRSSQRDPDLLPSMLPSAIPGPSRRLRPTGNCPP